MRIAVSFAAACLYAAAAVAPAYADDMADFQARYVKLKEAMDSREDRDIKALLTKEFESTDIRGEVKDADEMITQLAMMPDMPGMTNEVKVISVTVNGTSANAVSDRTMHMSRQGQDGATHAVEMAQQSNDVWVQTKGVWLLKSTETQSMTMKRDGVVMRSFKKGDPIPPRGMRGPGGPGGPRGDGPPRGEGPPPGPPPAGK